MATRVSTAEYNHDHHDLISHLQNPLLPPLYPDLQYLTNVERKSTEVSDSFLCCVVRSTREQQYTPVSQNSCPSSSIVSPQWSQSPSPPPPFSVQCSQPNKFVSYKDELEPKNKPQPKRLGTKRKRSSSKSNSDRAIRPKVVEARGAIQCCSISKKGTQCRNAALMEFMGPQPLHCAEHIEQDPGSIYEKCKSAYQKIPGDGKGCKEVVLKEFGVCYKHFEDRLRAFESSSRVKSAEKDLIRVQEILTTLESELVEAKRSRQDLYQRKNKLILKFQKTKKTLNLFLSAERNNLYTTTNDYYPHQPLTTHFESYLYPEFVPYTGY